MKKHIVAVALTLFSITGNTFERVTHQDLSAKAAKTSALATPSFLARHGLETKSLDEAGFNLFKTSEGGAAQSILNLIKFGADWEDGRGEILQSPKHFFNPLNGEPLSAGPFVIPVSPYYIPRIFGIPSPDWALEDNGKTYGDLPDSLIVVTKESYRLL